MLAHDNNYMQDKDYLPTRMVIFAKGIGKDEIPTRGDKRSVPETIGSVLLLDRNL